MKSEARKGLDWRSEFGRGGTEVGIARARDIVNAKDLSDSTVKRMYSFFSRHEVDKKAQGFRPGEKGYPSNGRIAWALWGGDAGFSWSKKLVNQMKKEERWSESIDKDDTIEPEQEVTQMERHVIGVEETEDSFIVEFRKGDMEAAQETVEDAVEEKAAESDDEEYQAMARDMVSDKVIYRTIDLSRGAIDEEKRIVRIGVSSETPVERDFGLEVLGHNKEDIDILCKAIKNCKKVFQI